MVVLTKKKGESKDNLFRKFTRAFIEEDVITDVRKKQFYKKPSLMR
jgi:ribosomal protein S21